MNLPYNHGQLEDPTKTSEGNLVEEQIVKFVKSFPSLIFASKEVESAMKLLAHAIELKHYLP